MKVRIVITILLLIGFSFFLVIYKNMQGPIEAELAVKQLEDSKVIYSASRATAVQGIVRVVEVTLLFVLVVIWFPFINRMVNKKKEHENEA